MPPRLHAWLLVALGGIATSRAALAQPTADASSCSARAAASSLALLGCSLAERLGPSAVGASVAVLELKSDRELPAADALRERLSAAVSAALRAASEVKEPKRSKLRVELSVEKSGGTLRVSADLRRATGLWQRVHHSKPRAEQHAFVEVPLDAELRSLIPPPPLVVTDTLKLKAPERGIVALACGPFGEGGAQELALVSRSGVRVGRIVGKRFLERKRVAWSALSPVAPVPLREPVASASITPRGWLRVGISDRRDGLELSPELEVKARFEALMPLTQGGCTARSGVGLNAQSWPCTQPAGPVRGAAAVLDAVSASAEAWIGRDVASGKLLGSWPAPNVEHAGAQLALGDADTDGDLELAYASDTLDAARDRLRVVTLQGSKLVPRFELALPGVSAVAICTRRESAGMAPIVVATSDELWLLR